MRGFGCLLIAASSALVAAAFSGSPANADEDDGGKNRVVVRCPSGSVQAAVDRASPGATIFIQGTCEEDVAITKDDITLSGNQKGAACDRDNPGGSGTLAGTITVDSVRAKIEFLQITGSGEGVTVINRADARLNCNDISRNQESGVTVLRSSNAVLRHNLVSENGQRRIDDPFVFFDCGLFAADASSVKSDGNTYAGNQYCAIEIDRQAAFQNGSFLPREPGNPADPAERDVFIERGCDPASGEGCFTSDGGPVAIEVFNGGLVDLRNAEVNGEVESIALSSYRVGGDAVLQGNILNQFNSMVRIRNRDFGDRSVSFTGTLVCTDFAQAFFSDVQCGQICSGDIPGTCKPEFHQF